MQIDSAGSYVCVASPSLEFSCTTTNDTRQAAASVANFMTNNGRHCLALYGDVGVGKTTFAKYFIQFLNPSIEDVTSPTFSLIQIYSMKDSLPDLWHADCYRLESMDEFEELGLDDAFYSNIVIIEWPNIIEKRLPSNVVRVYMSIQPNNARNVKMFVSNRISI